MSLNRLNPNFDFSENRSKGELFDTLELMAKRIASLQGDLDKVLDADKIVKLSKLQEYPLAAGQIYTGQAAAASIGDIIIAASGTTPAGFLPCDNTTYDGRAGTDYEDLYNVITTTFGGAQAAFNVPDLRGRVPVGTGTGTGGNATSWTMGRSTGDENLAEHHHEIADHDHTFDLRTGTGGSETAVIGWSTLTDTTGATENVSTETMPQAVSGSASGYTGHAGDGFDSVGAGDWDGANLQPSLGLAFYIRYQLGPSDVVQTLPISWGRVNGQWQLETSDNFPTDGAGVENRHVVVDATENPSGATVRVSASNGTLSSTTGINGDLKLVGVVEIPFNFKGWRTKAIRLKTKIDTIGDSSSPCNLTFRVSDPVSPGSYLSNTDTRAVSSVWNGSKYEVIDTEYVDMELTADDLGPDWQPGYLLRFELIFDHPRTFDTAKLEVGELVLDWN